MKKCCVCNIVFDYSNFHKMSRAKDGYRSICKGCRSKETKSYRDKNKDKIKENNIKFYLLKKEERKEYHAKWREKNREYLREYFNNKYKENIDVNRKKIAEYRRNRRVINPIFKIKDNVRTRIKMFFKQKGIEKINNTKELLGCDFETAKNHIESQFKDGMSWDNYGKWHIDHIKPLYLANTKDEIYELCNYKNLQPLWAKDNLIKGKIY